MKQSLSTHEMKQLVKIDPFIIRLWSDIPKEVEDFAFARNRSTLPYKKEITKEELITCMRNHPQLLEKIPREKITDEMLHAVYDQWWMKKEYIKKLSNLPKDLILKMIDDGHCKWEEINHQDEEEVKTYFSRFPSEMKNHTDYLTKEIMEEALTEDINSIEYLLHMPNPWLKGKVLSFEYKVRESVFLKLPKEVQIEVVKENKNYFNFLPREHYNQELIRTQFDKGDFSLFRYLKNPSEIDMIKAIRNNAKNIQYIENPSDKIQLFAFQQNDQIIK